MRRGARILLRVTLAVILVAAVAAAWFKIRYDRMVRVFAAAEVAPVDLARIDDGVYTGSFGEFLVSAEVEVTVENHRITCIDIVDQHCGPGYRALETMNRILAAQSPQVDIVTGATSSSRCIMIAVHSALTGAVR